MIHNLNILTTSASLKALRTKKARQRDPKELGMGNPAEKRVLCLTQHYFRLDFYAQQFLDRTPYVFCY
jgi:hypothetical protein